MDSVPVWLPRADGAKVTSIEQLPPGATDDGERGQLSVSWKSGVAVTPVITRGMPPLFVRLKVFAGLVVPTSWLPKSADAGTRLPYGFGGGVPVPASVAVCGL